MKRKKSELFLCIEVLSKDVEKYFDQAETEDIKDLFIRDNAIRRSVNGKKKIISDLRLCITNLEIEKRPLSCLKILDLR